MGQKISIRQPLVQMAGHAENTMRTAVDGKIDVSSQPDTVRFRAAFLAQSRNFIKAAEKFAADVESFEDKADATKDLQTLYKQAGHVLAFLTCTISILHNRIADY